jgi:hypothetical protein
MDNNKIQVTEVLNVNRDHDDQTKKFRSVHIVTQLKGLQMGTGLVIGFIGLLNTQLVTTLYIFLLYTH